MLFSICFSSVQAQNTFTTTSILGTIRESNLFRSDSSKMYLLNEYNYNIPFIRSVELRTESRDLLLERQEYTIRIKPNSFGAISNQRKLYQNKILEVEIEDQLKFNEELEKRYLLIVDYIFTERLIALFNEKQIQLNDKLTILGQSIYDSNFDVKDLIDAEDELLNTNLKLSNLKEERVNLQYLIKQFFNDSDNDISINTEDLIEPQDITEYTYEENNPDDHLEIILQNIKLDVIDNEMKVESSKSKQVFDYFQARYGGKYSFLFNENFSIGLGINLPFFGNTRERKGEYYFDKLNEESKLNELKIAIKEDQKKMIDAFNLAKTNYQTLYDQTNKSSVSNLLETYKKIEGISPLILLKLKILQHKKKIETHKTEYELYRSYIKLLVSKEILFQRPLMNHLSSTKELIDP